MYALLTFFFSIPSVDQVRKYLHLTPIFLSNFPCSRPLWHLCNTVNKFAMDKRCAQLWQRLSAALKPQISADSFKRWFSGVELIEAKDKSLTFGVPNNIYQFWIESNYMPALQTAIVTAFGSPRSIKFCSPSGVGTQTSLPDLTPLKEALQEPPGDAKPGATVPGLNPRNTFESFVVGP